MSSQDFDPYIIGSKFQQVTPESNNGKKLPGPGEEFRINKLALVSIAAALGIAGGVFGFRELRGDENNSATVETTIPLTLPEITNLPTTDVPTTEATIPTVTRQVIGSTIPEITSTAPETTTTTSTTTTTTTTTIPPTTTTVFVPQLEVVDPGTDQYGTSLTLLCTFLSGVIVNSVTPDQALRNIGMTDEQQIGYVLNNTRFVDDYALRYLNGGPECVPDNLTDIQGYLPQA